MFHVKPRGKTMTNSRSTEIEERAEQKLLAKHSQQTSLRKARRDRVVAGKADAFDCQSEEDVVCPHCGAWFDGELELGECIAEWQKKPDMIWHQVPCQECEKPFALRVDVKLTFTSRPI